jgi:uncharacterized membrane protein YkvA (DUF1232 family)
MKNEHYVRKGFWQKVRETMGDVNFVEEAAALYFCAIDPKTPFWVRLAAFAALAYFISPIDAMPDPIYIDDAGVIASAFKLVSAFVLEEHHRRARSWIAGGEWSRA